MAATSRGSSLSNGTEESGHLDAVTELGRALVEQLWPEDSADRLGMWMAHHVAELIEAVGKARGKEKVTAENRCRTAILELWSYRRSLDGRRPTDELEPLLDLLELLHADSTGHYYHRRVWEARREEGSPLESPETQKWLDLAQRADDAARQLVGWVLANAASAAVDRSLKWIELARKAGGRDDDLVRLVIQLRSFRPELEPSEETFVDPIVDRLATLKGLRKTVLEVEKELRMKLESSRR